MDELRKEYQVVIQQKLKNEFFNIAPPPPEEKAKKEGAAQAVEGHKRKPTTILDLVNLANDGRNMPPAFQNRLNDFN